MKEDTTAVKNTSPEEYEQGRLRYMIAWRDRRIAQLQQELKAHEERAALCDALMAYVLFRGATGETERELEIDKEQLVEFLSRWTSAVGRSENGYLICFSQKQEAEDAAPCAKE